MILTELNKIWNWIPHPDYFNYTFVQEIEIIVQDDSILVTDRDRARGHLRGLGDFHGRLRIMNFSDNSVWSSVEEALKTGYDYRFEIILRGRHDRTLTLVPVNIIAHDPHLVSAVLLAIETEQLIFPQTFGDFIYALYLSGLPVEWPPGSR